ncbi:hypothetical protein G6F55_011955 [Rhizopus delemar]|uniref:CCHC-type domain-containing protein n=2 Tax=Rhizopus TaxID=4842 RepID=A0A9P6YRY0_9FUNG|nr:hypothetical protein G6F55_011955 [Rhizopus delemar]KAG1508286.1 hypothetical protein G6F52_011427 [Rhizopus delemar]KAG1533822.1 hypothetical protein G6F51_012422 [Rhizopus arrhizus]KAG1560831.1 hypothetical protein G6F50_012268 [Rhizopus delemar]KAG1616731.1 hypothetical protein G6F45_012233 [Rhizopus arrhizus]
MAYNLGNDNDLLEETRSPFNPSQQAHGGKKVLRFLNDPRNFSGEMENNNGRLEGLSAAALTWWKRMDRIRVSADLSDEEILLVAGDHLTGKAELWWNVLGFQYETWAAFSSAFKKQYAADQEDVWWQELYNLKQRAGENIDDLSLRMRELLVLLNNRVDSFHVRVFLGAINPVIACEIERRDLPRTLDAAIIEAKKIEKSLNKYGSGSVDGASFRSLPVTGGNRGVGEDNVSVSTMTALMKELEQMRINIVQLQNERQRGPYPRPFNAGATTGCFYCKEEGHRKVDCPKLRGMGGVPVSGSNAVPLGGGPKPEQGEVSFREKARSVLRMVDVVDVVDVGSKEIFAAEKRRSEGVPVNPYPSSRPRANGVPVAVPTGAAAVHGHSIPVVGQSMGAAAGFPNNPLRVNPMPVVGTPKKRTRAKPRKLAVQTNRVNVWDVLSRTNAGASVADLLAVDRTVCKDLVDGVRFLRQGKRTVAVDSADSHRNGSSSVPMVVDTVQLNDDDWSAVDTDGDEGATWSEESSVDFSVSDVGSEVSSVYRYPYSLDNMKGSLPFKGLMSINGHTVECVFDSGASVSVISGGLASKLGLVPSNDEL